jgi:4-carboxymuconolactone decarboxylase
MHMQPKIVLHPSAIPTFESLNDEFPFLAGAVTDHMLGEGWHRRTLDPGARLLATVAMFAAAGDRTRLKIHAAHALNAGVTQDELKEIVYLTAVHSGLAPAIDAAQAISELLAERWEASQPIN